ncbi:hypothetical protein GCM10010156_49720 [Planobispora rosea]|uniref:Uncharacterized protein n=1 Tax=Planobispora rosea TaxID=35762 RepID=A0A8J3S3J5_PLARO|nr:hypothetical protein [Planobispora rosea]GGS85162.1 hypothetical protein GCM10010156_49720 [Planobispora rosea]GIH86483.1 hypothetical protein Pro02_48910 [Planobispora rosea]
MSSACHHFFSHWTTEEERQTITAALDQALQTGDSVGVYIALAQLTQPCDARRSLAARTTRTDIDGAHDPE